MDFVTFNVIVDDIVFPDGQTRMGLLGGGGPQTAYGMRLWDASVGIVGGVGPDLPQAALDWFARCGIDTAGLRFSDLPTPRAWQAMETDGRRVQVWRIPGPVIGQQLDFDIRHIPAAYRAARCFHFGIHPLEPKTAFTAALHDLGARVSVEPFKPAEHLPPSAELETLLSSADVFSPNLEEAVSLLGPGEPLALLKKLLAAGARVVALRMGADGSLAAVQGTGRAVHVPAVPVQVVDPVGAGNAYCGGFLAGWLQTGDLREAALRGAASASFLVEQVGVPQTLDETVRAEARRRCDQIRGQAQMIEL